jgi:hypothetical protein
MFYRQCNEQKNGVVMESFLLPYTIHVQVFQDYEYIISKRLQTYTIKTWLSSASESQIHAHRRKSWKEHNDLLHRKCHALLTELKLWSEVASY